MAVIARLSWSPVPGATGYLIEYKEQSSSIWITPTTPANPTLLTTYDITINEDTFYNARVSTECPTGGTTYRYVTLYSASPITYVWIPDTYTCEQDEVFTLDTTVSTLSSPARVIYDEPMDRYYVVDADDITSNFWWFDPATFTTGAGRNYIMGQPLGVNAEIQAHDYDSGNRRLLSAGPASGGLIAYNIASNTFNTVAYGTNAAFARLLVKVLGNNIYCSSISPATIHIIDKNALSLTSSIDVSTIPSGATYFNNSYNMDIVSGNIWVYAAAGRATSGNIAIYNSTLTSLITSITIPGAATVFNGRYWQTHFYDQPNNRWYAHDIGSSTLHVIDTTSNTVVESHTFTNKQGKLYAEAGVVYNNVTDELYLNYRGINDEADPSPIVRFYKLNRTILEFSDMKVNESVGSLSNRTGTNEFWAVSSGVFKWNVPNTGWDTDGQAFKYIL